MFVLLKHDTMDCHSYVGFQFYFYQILWIRLFYNNDNSYVQDFVFLEQTTTCSVALLSMEMAVSFLCNNSNYSVVFYRNLGYLIILANSTPFSCVMIQTTVQLFHLNLGYLIILANSTLSDCNLLHITHHTSYITTVRKPQILLFNSFLFGFCSSEYT